MILIDIILNCAKDRLCAIICAEMQPITPPLPCMRILNAAKRERSDANRSLIFLPCIISYSCRKCKLYIVIRRKCSKHKIFFKKRKESFSGGRIIDITGKALPDMNETFDQNDADDLRRRDTMKKNSMMKAITPMLAVMLTATGCGETYDSADTNLLQKTLKGRISTIFDTECAVAGETDGAMFYNAGISMNSEEYSEVTETGFLRAADSALILVCVFSPLLK